MHFNSTFFSCQLFQDPNHKDYDTYKQNTNFPSVRANVAYVRQWIDDELKNDDDGADFCAQ